MRYRVIKRGEYFIVQHWWKPWFAGARWSDIWTGPENPATPLFHSSLNAIDYAKELAARDGGTPHDVVWTDGHT